MPRASGRGPFCGGSEHRNDVYERGARETRILCDPISEALTHAGAPLVGGAIRGSRGARLGLIREGARPRRAGGATGGMPSTGRATRPAPQVITGGTVKPCPCRSGGKEAVLRLLGDRDSSANPCPAGGPPTRAWRGISHARACAGTLRFSLRARQGPTRAAGSGPPGTRPPASRPCGPRRWPRL